MQEIWKDIYYVKDGVIYDYRGLYQISNYGRIKSLEKIAGINLRSEKILKPIKDPKGYLRINLYKNGKIKNCLIHIIVAIMFIDNPDNLPEVNHKNEDKTCNEYWNLEWCTSKYNVRYSSAKKVDQYDLNGEFIKTWDCIREIQEKLKIHSANISKCCKGRYRQSGGFIWKYHKDTK